MKRRRIAASFGSGFGLVVLIAALQTASAATLSPSVDPCAATLAPIYQVVKPTTNASLVSAYSSEISSAKSNYGFTQDNGVAFRAWKKSQTGLVPVVRLYHAQTNDFVWVASASEVASAVSQYGYEQQSTDFYASYRPLACTTPVHRLLNGPMHRLAVASQVDALVGAGWRDEGVMFFAPNAMSTTSTSTSTTSTTPATTTPATTSVPTTLTPTTIRPTTTTSPSDGDADADGKFMLAIYPDTQMEVMRSDDERLGNRGDYLGKLKTTRDIRYVIQVGDLVNWDTDTPENPNDHRQYDVASREMRQLEATGIPWAGALGNHDTHAVGPTGGSARPGTNASVEVRNTATYNTYFGPQRFGSAISGQFESGKIDNAYRLFSAGGKQWMILNLELWPRPEAVTWAKSVVASHPNHNVIVVTHSYLTGSGAIATDNGGYGATSPKYLYDNLISQYGNIRFVFSGHVNTSAVRTDTGVKGNKIVSILTSFHDGSTNQTRFLEIDTRANAMSTFIEAPWTNQTFTQYNASVAGMSWVG